jgi:hypothetical protein
MLREAIVAVFRTSAEAAAAAVDLRESGIPDSAIRLFDTQHPDWGGQTTTAPGPDSSFWEMVFGGPAGAADEDTFEHGGTVLTVVVRPAESDQVAAVVGTYDLLELERRQEPGLGSDDQKAVP